MLPNASWIAADAPPGVMAGTTTRWHDAGTSVDDFANFNLALHTGDDPLRVARHREVVARALPGAAGLQWLEQVHGTDCVACDASTVCEVPVADAAWTGDAAVALAVMTADCVPVLIAARDGSCVAVAHAGWQGLRDGVLTSVLKALPVAAAELWVWLGPCIRRERYEVGEAVWRAFSHLPETLFSHVPQAPDKRLLDLPGIATHQLLELGVPTVSDCGLCTWADERFFSHRRQTRDAGNGLTGRTASIIVRSGGDHA